MTAPPLAPAIPEARPDARPEAPAPRHVLGPADAPVTVEMFGNYECLHCRRVWPAVAALVDAHPGQVRVVYRHFARPGDFPHAELAAEAAEAAGAQGRFWEMHRLLMTEAPALHRELLLATATALALDVERLDAALDARAWRDVVRADLALGLSREIRRTPTCFVNGVAVAPAPDGSALRAAVAEALGGR